MDLITILVGLLVVGASVLFVMAFSNSDEKMIKKMNRNLKKISLANNYQFSQYDVSRYFAIAMDSNTQQIIWVQIKDYDLIHKAYKLSEIKKCSIEEHTIQSKIKHNNANPTEISYINLKFQKKENHQVENLEVFSINNNSTITNEKAIAEKWMHIINGDT